jgi:alkylation response protein AidB-like acyl-CoA dehydrogenase
VLEGVRNLAPRLAAAAPDNEAQRRVAPELVEELRRIGIFRMFSPAAVGGLDLQIIDTMKVMEELAIADGSAGWIAMIGCHGPLFFAQLPAAAQASIFAGGPDVIGGGSVRPEGTAEPCEGGWRVTGKWGFASGCEHADWLYVWCIERGAHEESTLGKFAPGVRMAVVPARDFTVVDNWDVVGMKGSGSHDVALDGHVVPDDFTVGADAMPSQWRTNSIAILHLGACAVGIAEGALNDVTALALGGRQRLYSPTALINSPLAQHGFGKAEADVNAARAYLHAEAERCDTPATPEEWPARIAAAAQAAHWAAETCAGAVDRCFSIAGGTAIRSPSTLQRRLRDIHVLNQHTLIQARNYVGAALQRWGNPADPLRMTS